MNTYKAEVERRCSSVPGKAKGHYDGTAGEALPWCHKSWGKGF
jgi:hypothetical protein